MANHHRDAATEQHWRTLIRRWQRSGQTIRAFCADAHVSEPCFYAWRRELQRRDQEAVEARALPQRRQRTGAAAPSDPVPTFLPVTVLPTPAATLEIVRGNGRVVRLGRGFDAERLRQLLPIVEERPW
jgi:hypothetical protein